MKITQEKQPEQQKSITGACVGDQVIFSSHNPENVKYKAYMESYGVAFDTLYKVIKINSFGETNLEGLTLPTWGASENHIGRYDIIIRAEQPSNKFNPVTIVLETEEELDEWIKLGDKAKTMTCENWKLLCSFKEGV